MKQLFAIACTLVLGSALSFAQATQNPPAGDTSKPDTSTTTKKHHHHHGKKSKKNKKNAGGDTTVTADFNGDGIPDLGSADGSVQLGNGDGSFKNRNGGDETHQELVCVSAVVRLRSANRCSVCRGSRLSVVILAGAGAQPRFCELDFQMMIFVTLAGCRGLKGDHVIGLGIGEAPLQEFGKVIPRV